jgi:hypothetical protein
MRPYINLDGPKFKDRPGAGAVLNEWVMVLPGA